MKLKPNLNFETQYEIEIPSNNRSSVIKFLKSFSKNRPGISEKCGMKIIDYTDGRVYLKIEDVSFIDETTLKILKRYMNNLK